MQKSFWVFHLAAIMIQSATLIYWDSSRIRAIGQQVDQHPARGGRIMIGALSLYLDFINLFLLLRAANR